MFTQILGWISVSNIKNGTVQKLFNSKHVIFSARNGALLSRHPFAAIETIHCQKTLSSAFVADAASFHLR